MKSSLKDKFAGCNAGHGGNAVYGLGFIGAAIYYVTTATSFWMGIWGILKAIVWPALVVYRLMKMYGF